MTLARELFSFWVGVATKSGNGVGTVFLYEILFIFLAKYRHGQNKKSVGKNQIAKVFLYEILFIFLANYRHGQNLKKSVGKNQIAEVVYKLFH